jgi:hypothetical protein
MTAAAHERLSLMSWIGIGLAAMLLAYVGSFLVIAVDEGTETYFIDTAVHRAFPKQYLQIVSFYERLYAPLLWLGRKTGWLPYQDVTYDRHLDAYVF